MCGPIFLHFLQKIFCGAHIFSGTAALYCAATALRFGFAAVARHVFK